METFLIVASYFIVFSLGYIISRMNTPAPIAVTVHNPITQTPVVQTISPSPVPEKPVSFLSRTAEQKPIYGGVRNIKIDDSKFITEVKTDSLEKKFDDLGNTTVAKDESLSANVNKLASLKKSKED
jgi:hypothetical protein